MLHNIRLYTTLLRTVETFHPLNAPEVSMYACGVTTYDDAHLGHARQAIFFDVLRTYLEYTGYQVNYVRNYTDIDDKIIQRATEEKRDPMELSAHYVQETHDDLQRLKVRDATVEPNVTEHIPEIIEFIESLLELGHAYVAGGDVLFETKTFPTYGKLSRLNIDELINAEDCAHKRNPRDFALWKAAKPGEPSWSSPWGNGRPGWHIECSALANRYLGDQIDIHGGGIDLVFPHHENEIAQSESRTGKPFARYWIHNGLVMVDGQKMSKSLKNFITIKQALESYDPDTIRFSNLSVHYSSPLNFTDELFRISRTRMHYFYKTLATIQSLAATGLLEDTNPLKLETDAMITEFCAAMDDNMNTPLALSYFSIHFKNINRILSDTAIPNEAKACGSHYFLKTTRPIFDVLQLLNEEPTAYLKRIKDDFLREREDLIEAQIEDLIEARRIAKAEKRYTEADAIRDALRQQGVVLLDSGETTIWEIAEQEPLGES